jgi:hypothetical protein
MIKRHQREAVIESIHDLVTTLERRMDTMNTILLVREPQSVVAGEAYEGLRKQVVASVTERNVHLAQLMQFDVALRQGAGPDTLHEMVLGWIEQAGLQRVERLSGPERAHLFQMVDDQGGELEVLEPAYVDSMNDRVIRQGRVRRQKPSAPAEDARPDPLTALTPAEDGRPRPSDTPEEKAKS